MEWNTYKLYAVWIIELELVCQTSGFANTLLVDRSAFRRRVSNTRLYRRAKSRRGLRGIFARVYGLRIASHKNWPCDKYQLEHSQVERESARARPSSVMGLETPEDAGRSHVNCSRRVLLTSSREENWWRETSEAYCWRCAGRGELVT